MSAQTGEVGFGGLALVVPRDQSAADVVHVEVTHPQERFEQDEGLGTVVRPGAGGDPGMGPGEAGGRDHLDLVGGRDLRGWVEFVGHSERITEALNALSVRSGCTLFMTLLAGWQTLLCRYTAQTDIIVGTPTAGRSRSETHDLIGFFANTLPLRTDLQTLGRADGNVPPFVVRDGTGALKHDWLPRTTSQLNQVTPFELLPIAEMPPAHAGNPKATGHGGVDYAMLAEFFKAVRAGGRSGQMTIVRPMYGLITTLTDLSLILSCGSPMVGSAVLCSVHRWGRANE